MNNIYLLICVCIPDKLPFSCFLRCRSRLVCCPKQRSHRWHLKGFSLLWMLRMWRWRFDEILNERSQYLHLRTHTHIIRQYNIQTREIKLSRFICLAHTRGDWVVMNSLSLIFGQLSNTQTHSSTSSLCLENDCMCQVSSRRIIPYDYAIVSSPRPWSCALNCVSQEPVISPSLSPSRPPPKATEKIEIKL